MTGAFTGGGPGPVAHGPVAYGGSLERPDHAHLLDLLAAVPFGRLAFVHDGKPVIVVLNHTVEGGGTVALRTAEETLLARDLEPATSLPVAFEVDSGEDAMRRGWSVVVSGALSRVVDPAERAHFLQLVETWALDTRDVVMRLDVDHATAARVGRF